VASCKGTYVTETSTTPDTLAPAADAATEAAPKKSGGGLGGKVLAELQEIAGGLGIDGAPQMRKGALIDAIKTARGENGPAKTDASAKADKPEKADKVENADKAENADAAPAVETDSPRKDDESKDESNDRGDGGNQNNNRNRNQNNQGGGQQNRNRNQNNQGGGQQNRNNQNQNRNVEEDEDEFGGGRRRNRRGRNRNGGGRGGMEAEPTFTEDDILVPAAGILDILDNYAFVRTTGYLPSENDVYVSLTMVRKWGLRRGDAVIGQVRQPREGERKEKFNPMVKIDSVNGMTIDDSNKRIEFAKLTPLYPSERLRLEGEAGGLTGRVVDLVAPIGKGQRGLIVSPPKAGKTMIMQQVANAITENNPEVHLMIVLVDERPEEVTDFQRTVKGEVISSTFDRPATDHTMVAELAIERAKRLVELGHDVVLLLDGITRLGRAYNLAAPTSGRIMSGGVDSSALYPPKKFFGAARNIEDGGSLTILATALVETGSRMDEVIFEEFKGTGNWELRLRRDFADKRIFPAVDVDASSTRREELLMGKDELAVVWKLRRVLSGLEGQQGLELILDKLKKTDSNVEFLMQINKTLPQETNNGN
jgi:transcription termination factor Rho